MEVGLSQHAHMFERAAMFLNVQKIPRGDTQMAALGRTRPNGNQPIGIRVWYGAQQASVDHAKHGGIGPDADRQSEYRNGRGPRALTQQSRGVAKVLYQLLQPHRPPRFIEALLCASHISEGPARGGASLSFAETFLAQAVRLQFQMSPESPGRSPRRSSSGGRSCSQASAASGPSTCPIAAARRRHLVDSLASCVRPALVNV